MLAIERNWILSLQPAVCSDLTATLDPIDVIHPLISDFSAFFSMIRGWFEEFLHFGELVCHVEVPIRARRACSVATFIEHVPDGVAPLPGACSTEEQMATASLRTNLFHFLELY
jgi:hypothetical protein